MRQATPFPSRFLANSPPCCAPTARQGQVTEEVFIGAAWKSAPSQQWSLSTPDNLPQGPNLESPSFYVILLPQQKDNVGLGPLKRKI